MGFGRIVGGSFLGAMGANLLNDAIMGGFHRHNQFEYPYAYGPNGGFQNPAFFRPQYDYSSQFLPPGSQFFNGQQGWQQPRYPWGAPNGGYDQARANPNPMDLSEYPEGNYAAEQTLAKRNLCSSVQAIHDCEVMDAMTRKHFPGFQSHYARDMFNLEKRRLREMGYDFCYHQCPDNPNMREFGIFDRSGNLVDKMRIAKLQLNEIPNNEIRPVV